MYRRQVEEDQSATPTFLSKYFDVTPATVTETLQKLSQKGLVNYRRYYGAQLTEKGFMEGQKLLRKHRILEVLFVKFLGFEPDKACREASKVAYHCSQDVINSICRAYHHPDKCPCDKEIFRTPACKGGD